VKVLCAALLLAAASAFGIPPTSRAEAQQFAPAAVAMRIDEWRDATRAHARGQFDDVAASVAGWPPGLTTAVVYEVVKRARERIADKRIEVRESERAEARTALERGLLLHTDIAIAERTTQATTAAGGRTLRVLDSRVARAQRFSIHWALGRLLADALAKEPATAPIALGWYRAVAALHQHWADLGPLLAHLEAASAALPDDPVLLLYRGSLHQAHADARVQSFLLRLRAPVDRSTNASLDTLPIHEPAVELGNAERYLRRALALDESLTEARIRLAHVLEARGKVNDALVQARQALSSPLPVFLEYYGSMVLGRIEGRLGHAVEARAAFQRAAARYPRSQATQVALSYTAQADQRGQAVAALIESLGPAADAAEDPWSLYFRVHEPAASERLDDFRRSVP
jgi:tetratricopeptide (TPR) repeat protein